MRLFKCQACGQVLYFENTNCERCGRLLGYLPEATMLSALEPDGDAWRALARPGRWRLCDNAGQGACNWMVPDQPGGASLCTACRHNRIIPDLSIPDYLNEWRTLEWAKHRLFYTLLRFGLPLATRAEDPAHGLVFDFPAETPDQPKILTGHADGVITIALKEADPAERAGMAQQMGETYRTPLGHFRHEIAHYYWDVLVRDGGRLDAFRAVFGDETQDYAAALQAHYARPPLANWQESFVSQYASAHPWEDFAETWAHVLHIVDTLEMAAAFGIGVHPRVARDPAMETDIDFDPHRISDAARLIDAWLPLAFAVNSLNRSMGQPDLYPFVLSPKAIEKMEFVLKLMPAATA